MVELAGERGGGRDGLVLRAPAPAVFYAMPIASVSRLSYVARAGSIDPERVASVTLRLPAAPSAPDAGDSGMGGRGRLTLKADSEGRRPFSSLFQIGVQQKTLRSGSRRAP